MKAWRLGALGDPWDELALVDLEAPEPRGTEALVEVEGADVNFADILQCQGAYQVKLDVPFVPGMGAAGRVVAAGPEATVAVGDRVVGPTTRGWGGFAQQALVASDEVHRLPESVPGTTAAAIHVAYGTAWFALHRRGALQPGESVLVLAAAGGVGSAAVQMAKAHGCWVLAAAGGPDKVRACEALGADLAIDYRNDDLYEVVKDATSGRGVDVVYDPVGGEHFDVARRLVAWEGRLLVVGFASGEIPSAPANHALVKNYSVVGVHMGGYRAQDPGVFDECYDEVYRLLAEGEIDPLISEQVPLAGVPDVLRRMADRATTGRVVVEVAR